MSRSILTFVLILIPLGLCADEKPAERPKPDPESTPLEITITGKKTDYALNRGGVSAEEYQKKLTDAARTGKPLAVPNVDLVVELKNTSDQPIHVWTAGDPVVLTLNLKGKGAANLDAAVAFTREFRLPRAVELPAGKTHTIEVKSLTSGFRGRSHVAYWTEGGDYELVATFKTGVSPAPKGSKEGMGGFGVVTVTSPPFKLKVVEEQK